MAVTILLIVLLLTLLISGIVVYIFWKRVGKKLFNMINNLDKVNKTMTGGNTKLPDLTHYQKEMMRIQEMINKHLSNKKK